MGIGGLGQADLEEGDKIPHMVLSPSLIFLSRAVRTNSLLYSVSLILRSYFKSPHFGDVTFFK